MSERMYNKTPAQLREERVNRYLDEILQKNADISKLENELETLQEQSTEGVLPPSLVARMQDIPRRIQELHADIDTIKLQMKNME